MKNEMSVLLELLLIKKFQSCIKRLVILNYQVFSPFLHIFFKMYYYEAKRRTT